MSKYDFQSDIVSTLNQAVTLMDQQNDARTNASSESMIGSFARIMYNYGEKYYLTSSLRRDGSSKFGYERRWGIFPSISAAWRISSESFFEPLSEYINDLKIRGGWGVIGNSGIGNYNAISSLSSFNYVLGTKGSASPGYQQGKVSNSNLGWEETTDYGIGLDAEILNSRISFTMDYFYKLTEEMLFNLPLPDITGFNSYLVNIGSMRNRGMEYLVKTQNIVGNFNWRTTFNLSYYRNRLLDTGTEQRPLISNNSYSIEGKPLAGLWGYYFLGPFKDWEEVKSNPGVNPANPNWQYRSYPGTQKLYDVNRDGKIDASDMTIIGNPNPDFVWGMTNTFNYKNFDLTVQFSGVKGGKRLNTQLEAMMARGAGLTNVVYEYFNNYWRPDRTDAKYAAPSRKSWDATSSRGTLVFDQSYFNIQNVRLGYTLPRNTIQKMNIGQLYLFLNIQNALVITDYPGYNPEVNAAGNSALIQGIDAGAYPLTRIVSLGINMSL